MKWNWAKGWQAVLALVGAWALLSGCGTVAVTLPRNNRTTPTQAVSVVERTAKLNALSVAPEFGLDDTQAWADDEGWYAVEDGRIIKLFFSDIDTVTRCYAQRSDVAASACVAGLMGPFSGAYVEVAMTDGKVWRMKTDPEGDAAVCLNCAPMWLITFPRPMSKTRRIGEAFEFMRVKANLR